ncbi:MAG: Stp1/IreP family PP2C-type Ser/Thr phosphatase [Bacteroidia bacterium]|nr:Stp1/IreP family PP2C-type Ser/Thr phosphatase [Bacteroidia bacterium]
MDIQEAHLSDIGKIRKVNEDTVQTFRTEGYFISVMCDGLGGHAGGAVAASLCANTIIEYLKDKKHQNIENAIAQSISKANEVIHTQANTEFHLRGMGTTCVVCVLDGSYIYFAHVGDTRLYQYKDNQLLQLTKDHSYVQQLIDEGKIQPSDAEIHPQKHQLTAAVGTQMTLPIAIEVQKLPLQKNTLFLLCTDGLHGIVSNKIIQSILSEYHAQPVEVLAKKLVDTANDFGGIDNVTVQIIRVNELKTSPQNSIQNTQMTTSQTSAPLIDPPIEVVHSPKTPAESKPKYKVHLNNYQKLGLIVIVLLATVITLFVAFYKAKEKTAEENFLTQLKDSLFTQPNTSVQKNEPVQDTTSTQKAEKNIPELIDYEYFVRKGDVLPKIAQKFNVSVEELKAWNKDAKKKGHPKFPELNADAPLVVKIKAKHTVSQGETLSAIAQQYYGNSQQKHLIMKANNLKENEVLKQGKVLVIPKP